MRTVLDTSFLMIPGAFGVDVASELDRLLERRYELLVPSPVLAELKRLASQGTPSERLAARVGIALAKRAKVVRAQGKADEVILEIASKGDCVVATTDAALKKELRRRGVPVVYLRQKSHLALDGRVG